VTSNLCSHETELWDAIAAGRWPDTADANLRAHVASCAACRDLALVAGSLRRDARDVARAATPPTSAIVWWRAQMRARQEAAHAADRPITFVQGLAIACAAGLLLGLTGSVAASVRGSTGWFSAWSASAASAATRFAAIDFSNRWVLLPAVLIVLSLLAMPVAIYAIMSDEQS
jgi:predicted anti-sigma-YlaC factor YlaD